MQLQNRKTAFFRTPIFKFYLLSPNIRSSFANLFNFKFSKTCWKSPKLYKGILAHFEKMSLARWLLAFCRIKGVLPCKVGKNESFLRHARWMLIKTDWSGSRGPFCLQTKLHSSLYKFDHCIILQISCFTWNRKILSHEKIWHEFKIDKKGPKWKLSAHD